MRLGKVGNDTAIGVKTGGRFRPIAIVEDDGVGRVGSTGRFRPVVSDSRISRLGCSSPPLHPHCRSVLLPVFSRTTVSGPRTR